MSDPNAIAIKKEHAFANSLQNIAKIRIKAEPTSYLFSHIRMRLILINNLT
jgi:hypothetical protein